MENDNQQDIMGIRMTQLPKPDDIQERSGWLDDGWHILMIFLGLGMVLMFLLLILWQSGGINGLAELWLLQTRSELQSVPIPEEKLIYRNSNLGVGFEYSPNYQIEQLQPEEVKVTMVGLIEEEVISVLVLGLKTASTSGELVFDCSKYIEGCKKIDVSSDEYTTSSGIKGQVNNEEIVTSSGSGNLRTYTFDINHIKFAKLIVFPLGENSNRFAQELAEKIFLIEPTNQ